MSFLSTLITAAAATAKASAQAKAQQPGKRKAGTTCTPCNAHAFVDRIRQQSGMNGKKR